MSSERIDLDELAALEDQRRFLLRSLEDLDGEREAGDIDVADYDTLKADYTHRAAEVIRAIEGQRELHRQARPEHSLARKMIAVLAVGVVAIVAGLVVASAAGEQSGDVADGGMELAPSSEVEGCITMMQSVFRPVAQGEASPPGATDALDTIKCFTERISEHPDDAVAYTYRGWSLALLARQLNAVASPADVQAFVQRATKDLAKARELAPQYPDALTFSAITAVWTEDLPAAERYLAVIDSLRLPANSPILASVNQMLRPMIAAARTANDSPGEPPTTAVEMSPDTTSASTQQEIPVTSGSVP